MRYVLVRPIPVAMRSMRSFAAVLAAEIAGSDHGYGLDVRLLCLFYVV